MTSKNILIIGPDPTTATDGIIAAGTEYLLKKAFPVSNLTHFQVRDFKDMPYTKTEEYDLIVYAGSPFLWDGMASSYKVKNTMKVKEAHKGTRFLFMGIGSCLDLGREADALNSQAAEIKEIFDDTEVIVRDPLAFKILCNIGVEGHSLMPCPSFYCYGDVQPQPFKTTPLIEVRYLPEKGVSASSWQGKDAEFQKYFTGEGRQVCAGRTEAKLMGWEHIGSRKECLDLMYYAKKVVSGRVHMAIPAFVAGADVTLIAVDSRHLTLSHWQDTFLEQKDTLEKNWITILRGEK
jgi:hypothetical protein